MKKIILATFVAILVTTAGCTMLQLHKAALYAIDTSTMVSALVKLDDNIKVARAAIRANEDKFTPEEWSRLQLAGARIDSLRQEFSVIFGEDVTITKRFVSGKQLRVLVKDVVSLYNNVEEIILLHADEFSLEQRTQVLAAKATLDTLKSSYEHLLTIRAETDGTIDATNTAKSAIEAMTNIVKVFKK